MTGPSMVQRHDRPSLASGGGQNPSRHSSNFTARFVERGGQAAGHVAQQGCGALTRQVWISLPRQSPSGLASFAKFPIVFAGTLSVSWD
jgi:hypothetical protein